MWTNERRRWYPFLLLIPVTRRGSEHSLTTKYKVNSFTRNTIFIINIFKNIKWDQTEDRDQDQEVVTDILEEKRDVMEEEIETEAERGERRKVETETSMTM